MPCTVDLNISAHIPERYIDSLPARLGIYKRIADIKSEEDSSDVIDELCDRFGEPPEPVMGLIDIAMLRNKAAAAGITEITGNSISAILNINTIDSKVVERLSACFAERFVISAGEKPHYVIRLKKGQKMSDLVAELGKAL